MVPGVLGEATAAIIIIGDEILSGQFADENSGYLARALRDLGVTVTRIEVISDDLADIAATVASAAERNHYVFTTGGVGPTHDDVTMEGIARAFGKTLVREPRLVARLERHLGRPLSAAHLRLAEIPAGAEILGEEADAPVVAFGNVYIFPGIPALVRRKFSAIAERFRCAPFFTGSLFCRAAETELKADLDRAVSCHPDVVFGSYPRDGESDYRVLITAKGKSREAVAAACSDLAAAMAAAVVRLELP